MINFLVRTCSSTAAKFISPSNTGHSNGYSTVRSTIASIFTRALTTTSSLKQSSPKHRNWAYLTAGLFTGACLCFARLGLIDDSRARKKTSSEEVVNFEGLPKPISSISSGTYKAACYHPIPPGIVQKMMGKSYKENCPIPITDLVYVTVTHYDMQGQLCLGELVVHKKIADLTMEIFQDIHAAKFPIEKIRLIDEYEADDDRSMEDNNSSAFCFRNITNKPGVISNHGLGIAIDINTRLNPYVKGSYVAPSNAQKYVDRSLNEPGMIDSDGVVVRAFKQRGFLWGGDWESPKDYQHFEHDRKKLMIQMIA